MKRMRSLVVVEAWRTRREVAYAVMRTERAAKRERTVVRSIIRVEGGNWVSISVNWFESRCYCSEDLFLLTLSSPFIFRRAWRAEFIGTSELQHA